MEHTTLKKSASNGDWEHCPICGEKWHMHCKCMIGDMECKNGHAWFQCPVHHIIIIGKSDHKKGSFDCHCNDANTHKK